METGPATLQEREKGRPWGSRRPLVRLEGDGAEQLRGWNYNLGPARHLGLETLQRNSGSHGKSAFVWSQLTPASCSISSKISSVGDKGWWAGQELGFCQREGKGWKEQEAANREGCEWGYL